MKTLTRKTLSLTILTALSLVLASAGPVQADDLPGSPAEDIEGSIDQDPEVAGHARSETLEGGEDLLAAVGQAITLNERLTASSRSGRLTSFYLRNPRTGELMRVAGRHVQGSFHIARASEEEGTEEEAIALEDMFEDLANTQDELNRRYPVWFDESHPKEDEAPATGKAVIARGRLSVYGGGTFVSPGSWLAQYRIQVAATPELQEDAEAIFDEAFGPEARRGQALELLYSNRRLMGSRLETRVWYARMTLDLPLSRKVLDSLGISSSDGVDATFAVVKKRDEAWAIITVIGTASGAAVSD